MPTASWLQLACGIVALLLLIITWWINKNDEKRKQKEDIDNEIDKANDAHAIVKLLNKLRNK